MVIPINRSHAAALNQELFVTDARRAAFMPVSALFLPGLELSKRGIQGQASLGLKAKIENTVARLFKRPDLIQCLGPERRDPQHRAPHPDGREDF